MGDQKILSSAASARKHVDIGGETIEISAEDMDTTLSAIMAANAPVGVIIQGKVRDTGLSTLLGGMCTVVGRPRFRKHVIIRRDPHAPHCSVIGKYLSPWPNAAGEAIRLSQPLSDEDPEYMYPGPILTHLNITLFAKTTTVVRDYIAVHGQAGSALQQLPRPPTAELAQLTQQRAAMAIALADSANATSQAAQTFMAAGPPPSAEAIGNAVQAAIAGSQRNVTVTVTADEAFAGQLAQGIAAQPPAMAQGGPAALASKAAMRAFGQSFGEAFGPALAKAQHQNTPMPGLSPRVQRHVDRTKVRKGVSCADSHNAEDKAASPSMTAGSNKFCKHCRVKGHVEAECWVKEPTKKKK
jgi:hypothetical protein